jgi:hypothetical protein
MGSPRLYAPRAGPQNTNGSTSSDQRATRGLIVSSCDRQSRKKARRA